MVLKTNVIKEIRANRDLRNRLMCDLPISHGSLYIILRENKKNNALTKVAALDLISQSLKIDKRLLVEPTIF